MTCEIVAFLPSGIYDIDPKLAEKAASDLGVRLIVRDTLFDPNETRALEVCDALEQIRFDLPQFERPAIDNRAARRHARFARCTNSAGWKA